MKNIREFKNIYKGNRAFVLGNGPSLNDVDFSLLEDEITIGCNQIGKIFSPTFVCCSDENVYKNNKELIDNTDSIKVYLTNPDIIRMSQGVNRYLVDFADIDKCYEGIKGGVLLDLALPLAHYIGIDTVYLLGASYMKRGHFFDNARNFSLPSNSDKRFPVYEKLRKLYNDTGRFILNATPKSNLYMFNMVKFEDII